MTEATRIYALNYPIHRTSTWDDTQITTELSIDIEGHKITRTVITKYADIDRDKASHFIKGPHESEVDRMVDSMTVSARKYLSNPLMGMSTKALIDEIRSRGQLSSMSEGIQGVFTFRKGESMRVTSRSRDPSLDASRVFDGPFKMLVFEP